MRFNFLRTILLPVVLSASIILSSALIPAVPVSSNSAAVVESVTAASSQKDVSAETIVLINTDGFSQSALNMTLGQAITWQNETDSVQVIQLAEIDIPDGSTIFLPFVSSEPNAKAAATTYSSDADKTITVQPRQKLSYVISSLQDYQFTLQDQSSTLEVNVTEPDSLVLFHIGDQETALGTSITLNLQAYDPGGSQDISFDVAPLPLPTNAQFDAGTGLFTFRPTSTQTGSYNLTFMTNTGQQTATESVTIDVPEPDPNAPTSLRGQILDANDAEQGIITPLVGATVRLVDGDQSVSTDSDGYFELSNLPDEAQYVEFDGSTATPAGTYGAYRSLQVLIPHVTNVIERPIYIMEVDESGTVQIEPNESIELINPSLGVTVTIPANNVKMDDGSDYSGPISISEVPDEFTPGSLPDNLDPGQVFTIQPMGLTFDEPAPITFPNTEGFTPGSEVNIWSMDHETSEFFVAGKGRVSDDGTVVETIEGGIQESSWHFLAALGAALSEIFDDLVDFLGGTDCDVASSVTLHNGCLGTTIDLPAYAAQDSVQGLSLVYKSDRAYPQLLAPYAATVPLRSAVPNRIGQEVNFAGIGLTNEVFISTADFSESQDETYRSVVYVDTSDLETGVYPYNIRLTNYFANSTVSTDIPRRALVVNSRNSSLGAGWGLSGLQRLYVQANGNILLVNGDGSAMNFTSGKIGFPDFNDISNLLLNGDASALNTEPVIVNGNSVLRLTSAERWQGSSAFYTNPFAVTQSGENLSFKTYFQFQITTPGGLGGGADGLTFVIVSALNNIGGDGGGIGYSGINNSIAVEFDTFRNGRDPNDSHVGIDLNGSLTSEITANIDPNLKDSDIWSAWIEYDGQTERLDVRLSRTDERPLEPILSHSVDLATILGQDRAFLGFTSATGAGYANHDILSWDVEVLGELADEPNRYFPPAGEYSELIQLNDGSFEYRLNDGIYYRFNIKGLQTAMVDRNGNTTSFAYDGQNRLKTITDPVGKPTAFTYEGDHLKTITNPDGRVTTFTHDGNGNLTSVAYPDTTSQSFTYDANHLMTAETDRRGNQTIRNYDRFGRLVSATLPDGTVRQHSYSQVTGLIDPTSGLGTKDNPAPPIRPDDAASTLIDGENRTTTYAIGSLGRPGTITDPAGFVTTTERDDNGNPTRVTLPSGAVYIYAYDNRGNLNSLSDETTGGTFNFTYESSFNQVTSVTDAFDNITTMAYDDQGNLTQSRSPLGRVNNFAYDSQGLPTVITDTLGTQTRYTYDANGNATHITINSEADSRSTAMSYTAEGYVQTATDALNRTATYAYDAMGRVTQETLSGNRTILYSYDADGNLASLTPPERPAHQFKYDSLGQVTAYIPPNAADTGTTRTTYQYNNAQQLTTLTRPDDGSISYTYDDAGRLTKQAQGRGLFNFNTGYAYSDSTGQLTQINTTIPETSATNNVILDYGYQGELLTSVQMSGDVAGTVEFAYDAQGRVRQDTVNGTSIAYAFDADSALTQAGDLSLTYDAATGLYTSATLGNTIDAYAYNDFGELTRQTVTVSGGTTTLPYYDVSYGYDALGRIITKTEVISAETNSYIYGYDAAGRLENVTQNGTIVESYRYDANGNRIEGTGGVTGSYDDQDRLLSYGAATYAYTAYGELLTKTEGGQTTTYSYDLNGNLLGVNLPDSRLIQYLVDGQNRRIGKRVNGTVVQGFLYQDQLNPIAELDGSGNIVSRFIYGNRINVPEYMVKDGTIYRFITDHLGSVRMVINSQTGEILQRMDYDAWGKVLQDTNPGFQPFGFAGGIYDVDTRLIRFGARDYDVETGRWTAKDPIGFGGDDTNLYAYGYHDPVNLIDPSGAVVWFVPIAISTAGGVAGGAALSIGIQYAINGCINWNQVGRDAAIGGVLGGLGKAIQIARAANAAHRLERARQLGRAGEAASGLVKNTNRIPSASGTAAYRIPDGLTRNTLSEVKNVSKLSYTNQLRDFAAYARETGRTFELYVRPSTTLSGPLENAIRNGDIILRFLP